MHITKSKDNILHMIFLSIQEISKGIFKIFYTSTLHSKSESMGVTHTHDESPHPHVIGIFFGVSHPIPDEGDALQPPPHSGFWVDFLHLLPLLLDPRTIQKDTLGGTHLDGCRVFTKKKAAVAAIDCVRTSM